MVSRVTWVVGIMTLATCAYPQEPRERPASVLVYASESEVPCSFEIVRRLQAQGSVPFPSSRADQDRERDRVLIRAAERIGADAVVLVPVRTLGSGTIGIQTDTMPSRLTLDFFGDAIRFVPGTCRS